MKETMVRACWYDVFAIVALSLAVLATNPRSAEADDKALGTDGKVYLAAASTDAAAKPDKADESGAKLDAKLNPWPNQHGFISPTFNGPWRFRAALNAFLPTSVQIHIDDPLGNESITLGTDFLLGNIKFAIPLDFQVRKGSFGLYWHTYGFKIDGGNVPVGRKGDLTYDITGFWMDVGLSYELGKWTIGEGPDVAGIKVTVEPIIGARLWYEPLVVNLSHTGKELDADFTSYVPMIGLRTYWDLDEHWNLYIAGDYGGFGVMDNRQTWQGVILAGYRWRTSRHGWNVQGGFRALRTFDYQFKEADVRQDVMGPNVYLSIDF
jgi:hypothetical protein